MEKAKNKSVITVEEKVIEFLQLSGSIISRVGSIISRESKVSFAELELLRAKILEIVEEEVH